MDAEFKKERKLKLKKKLLVVRDILMVMLALFFIIIGFSYAIDNGNIAGDGYRNIRYGLFSFALIFSATLLLITVYFSNRRKK
jgi:TRAP-type C4-dicarboxylate transport system permease small subunit